jgi:prolipoprotein diacylglyceryltransferase
VIRAYGIIVVCGLILWLLFGAWRLRKRRVTPGAAAAAAMNDLLNNDRRAAVEIIVAERAAAKDAEDRDGNLPDLEKPNPN